MKKTLKTFLTLTVGALGLTLPAAAADTQRYLIETRERPALAERFSPLQQSASPVPAAAVEYASDRLGVVIADLTPAQAAALARNPSVKWIEPDQTMRMSSTSRANIASTATAGQAVPYGVTLVRADKAWARTRGAGVRVAVADTGIDYRHPDIAPNYAGGYDFYSNDKDPMDDNGHGTHVAGTIAAADNGVGVIGVAPEARLYALRVLGKEGNGSASLLIKAIDWALANDIDILSMSLGFEKYSEVLAEAFRKANEAGLLSIAASGNSYVENPVLAIGYPAAFPGVVAVGAIDSKSAVAAFSQRGTELKIVAPGVAVTSSVPVGTSAASAVEAGSTSFDAHAMTGSPRPSAVSGQIVSAGLGLSDSDFAGVRGKIALIERGQTTFAEKAGRAKAAGAIGVIVYNSTGNEGMVLGTLEGNALFPGPFAPSVGVSRETGLALLQQASTQITMRFGVYDYEALNGTSMATPHVSGVAALIKSLNPDATAAQIQTMLILSAADLGDRGWDTTYGFGVVDAEKATATSTGPARRRSSRR